MISILRKETHRVDHDLHWASIGHIRSYPPKGHDLLANLMLSNGSNQLSHGKVRPFPDARLTPRRSRIFVTSASTMHTLMSVLRFGHLLRDGCRNLGTWGTWSEHQPVPFGDPGSLQQLRPGISVAGYELLRISGFCCCFRVQL